ncbi:MAG: hypothetical protein ABI367_11795 [Mucilaginibacter sp.]
MNEKSEKLGNIIVFSILIPLVTAIVYCNYGYRPAIAMLVFFAGMYCYFNWFLNITLCIKYKTLKGFTPQLILYAILSVALLIISYYFFGSLFTIKNFYATLVIFIGQLFFMFKKI